MNDDTFLYAYRRPPNSKFAAVLYRRLSTEPRIRITFAFSPLEQLKRGLNVAGAALAVLLAISPDVRARFWEHIMNLFLVEREVTQWSTNSQ